MEIQKHIKRGEIYYADLNPVFGSEQGGIRPVLILSNDIGNRYSPTVIVAAITSRDDKAQIPTHVLITNYSFIKNSTVLLEQIRTIDRSRLQSFVGCLDRNTMRILDDALSLSVGLKI